MWGQVQELCACANMDSGPGDQQGHFGRMHSEAKVITDQNLQVVSITEFG